MQNHPFTTTILSKMIGVLIVLFAIAVQSGLLIVYGDLSPEIAIIHSTISIGIMGLVGYMSWYFLSFLRVWQSQVVLTITTLVVSQGVSFFVLFLLGVEHPELLVASVPLCILFGLLSWIILLQWYWGLQKKEEVEAEIEQLAEAKEPAVTEQLEHISVKDGTRIHIIHFAELIYLQASGDYVTLFTTTGQYIKEQTMKYFETNLPSGFVRIHRSNIVNMEQILRVELFGKENYQVRLKNGVSLRASNAGYKLLKERLNL